MTATGQRAEDANAAAVDPIRPCAQCLSPIEPTHSSAAHRDPVSRAWVGRSCKISTSILTGLSVASTAVNACLTATSALARSRAVSRGSVPAQSGSIANTRRNGISRLTASSTAHSAASIADREPSIPTTTARDGEERSSMIAPMQLDFVRVTTLSASAIRHREAKVPVVRSLVLRANLEHLIHGSARRRGRYVLDRWSSTDANEDLGCDVLATVTDQPGDDLAAR